jgi:excisionase family DNA binding protein
VEEDFYTVDEAARILKLTPGRIRQMLRAGELKGGVPPEEAGGRGWKIPMHAVHDRDRPARIERLPEAPEAPEKLSELEAEVRDLRYRLGAAERQAELTEKTESTIREERDRLLAERDRERERAERLAQELEEERSRGFWSRLFGR